MLDTGFLEAEDADRHVSLAIGSVSVLEGPILDDDALVSGLTERVLAVPRFGQVLRTHVLDLHAPESIDAELRHLPSRASSRASPPATRRRCSGLPPM
jgi:diacylglycerol O-acyltransferase / wax synthase